MFRKKVKEVVEVEQPKTVYELKVYFIEKKDGINMFGSRIFT